MRVESHPSSKSRDVEVDHGSETTDLIGFVEEQAEIREDDP